MDMPNIPVKDLYKNYKELHWVNQYLGGYKASIFGVSQAFKKKSITKIIDVGSGGGDTLAILCKKFKIKDGQGIDSSDVATQCASEKYPYLKFHTNHYKKSRLPKEKVLIHTALFNHHLNPEENIAFLKWAAQNSAILVMNDLQRNIWAWLGIYTIQLWPSFSYLFKNDAPLSVQRAHSFSEWKHMLKLAGYTNYSIIKKPMFRYVIIASI